MVFSFFLNFSYSYVAYEHPCFKVEDGDVCPVCFKKFRGQTAIVRFPNGRVVHYFCQERAIVPNL